MCGLFGVAGKLTSRDKEVFYQLGYPSMLRGTDGTGVTRLYGVQRGKKGEERFFNVEKDPIPFVDFAYDTKNTTFSTFKNRKDYMFMGHVRAATLGKLVKGNTHPFYHGNLVVSHNGTLKDDEFLPEDDSTDSEMLVRAMAKEGIEEPLKRLTKDSAYALSIFDKSDTSISLVRNAGRPLAIAYNTDRDVIYWASEANMLHFILLRNDINYKIEELGTYELRKVNILDIDKDKGTDMWERTKIGFKVKQVTFNKADIDNPWCYHCNNYMSNKAVEDGNCSRRACPGFDYNEEITNWQNYNDRERIH